MNSSPAHWGPRVSSALLVCLFAIPGTAAETPIAYGSEIETLIAIEPLLKLRKDAYETTAAFSRRLCAATSAAVKADPDGSATFRAFPTSSFAYDADKMRFSIWVSVDIPGAYNMAADRFIGISLAAKTSYKPSYIGSNGFGASKEVLSSEKETVSLLVPRRNDKYSLVLYVPATPDVAKQLAGDLQLVVTSTIVTPCFITGTYRTSPTYSSPSESNDTMLGVIGSKSIWKVIKRSTGRVIKQGNL